jgi:hypothetical protein
MTLANFMELSPSQDATNCAATREFPKYFMEPGGSLTCSQQPSTDPYPGPDESSPYYPILRSILILCTHLCFVLPSGLLPSGFPINILFAFRFSPVHPICPAHLILLDLIIVGYKVPAL